MPRGCHSKLREDSELVDASVLIELQLQMHIPRGLVGCVTQTRVRQEQAVEKIQDTGYAQSPVVFLAQSCVLIEPRGGSLQDAVEERDGVHPGQEQHRAQPVDVVVLLSRHQLVALRFHNKDI
jgi:hypothetical protein